MFFALYTPMQETLGGGAGATAVAAMAATLPSTLVGVPADTIKKQLVTGQYPSAAAAALGVVRQQGPAGLFRGWQANVARDVPFAVLKMSLYEGLAAVYKSLRVQADSGAPLNTLDHGVVRAKPAAVLSIAQPPARPGSSSRGSTARLPHPWAAPAPARQLHLLTVPPFCPMTHSRWLPWSGACPICPCLSCVRGMGRSIQ